jgi:hypothetical protein
LFGAAHPPVLGFSARQKRVFLQAVRGYSNASIAARLGIGKESVHSCFRIGYDKIGEHPVLSAEMEDEARIEAGKARSRKREIFFDILRRHPEELRPWRTKPALKRTGAPAFSASAQ